MVKMKILILILIVSFQGGNAFMEDVKTALNSARGYLGDYKYLLNNKLYEFLCVSCVITKSNI